MNFPAQTVAYFFQEDCLRFSSKKRRKKQTLKILRFGRLDSFNLEVNASILINRLSTQNLEYRKRFEDMLNENKLRKRILY